MGITVTTSQGRVLNYISTDFVIPPHKTRPLYSREFRTIFVILTLWKLQFRETTTTLIMKTIQIPLILIICFLTQVVTAQQSLDLSGNWSFQLDYEKAGERERWYARDREETIRLPGSTTDAEKPSELYFLR